METRPCRSCGSPVLFVTSAVSRATMILDAEPVPGGSVVIEDGKARVLKRADLFDAPPDGPRYTDHHSTCPDAASWRRTGKKRP